MRDVLETHRLEMENGAPADDLAGWVQAEVPELLAGRLRLPGVFRIPELRAGQAGGARGAGRREGPDRLPGRRVLSARRARAARWSSTWKRKRTRSSRSWKASLRCWSRILRRSSPSRSAGLAKPRHLAIPRPSASRWRGTRKKRPPEHPAHAVGPAQAWLRFCGQCSRTPPRRETASALRCRRGCIRAKPSARIARIAAIAPCRTKRASGAGELSCAMRAREVPQDFSDHPHQIEHGRECRARPRTADRCCAGARSSLPASGSATSAGTHCSN